MPATAGTGAAAPGTPATAGRASGAGRAFRRDRQGLRRRLDHGDRRAFGDRRDLRHRLDRGHRSDLLLRALGHHLERDQAHQSHEDDQPPPGGMKALSIRSLLQHHQSPFQSFNRGRGARRGQPRDPRRHAQSQEKPAIGVRSGIEDPQHLRIAGGLAGQRILAHREPREGVKEEQPLRQRRHPAEPQVAATHMEQLMAEGHRQLCGREAGERAPGKQDPGRNRPRTCGVSTSAESTSARGVMRALPGALRRGPRPSVP